MNEAYFRLAATDFGVEIVRLDCQAGMLLLEIIGDSLRTQTVAAKEDGLFNWVLYPPKLYFRNVPYTEADGIITLVVNEELLDEYDIALYLLSHYDVQGTLAITGSEIVFRGEAELDNQKLALHIKCETPLRKPSL